MRLVLSRHDEIVRAAIATFGGSVFKHTGVGLCAAFASAPDALAAAVGTQTALAAEQWLGGVPLRVRIGLHTGTASPTEGDYFGPTVNRAARVMSAGHGGQVVCSAATAALCREAAFRDAGLHLLAGVGPERLLVAVAGEDDARPLRSIGMAPTNLAGEASSFVGRESEVAEVAALLGSHRLVSLVGPGGIGKTRLAVESAAAAAALFGDGVWFCDLAPLGDGNQVPASVADAIGARQQPGMSRADSVVQFLEHRRCLLILDNCEHVLDAAARLARRLIEVEGPVVLATSRELLGMRGEQLWPVAPLDTSNAAVHLFLDRARERDPHFEVDDAGRDAVLEICRRVDGIPLAIELTAARTSALSPQAIAARLHDRFRLLRGGRRGERHQTLRDALQWSYELLSDAEARLFDRLSVFAGGFSLDAAEAVCADDPLVDGGDVLDLVTGLVDKSMVQRDRGSGERFVLLETLRQFAEEQLHARGDSSRCRDCHARYYGDLVVAEEARLASAAEPAGWQSLHEEWDNIRAAFDHAHATSDKAVIADITAGLGWFSPMSFRTEAGDWARMVIQSGLLVGHPAETAVRGTWALTLFHLSGGQAFAGIEEALGDPARADQAAGRSAAWLTAEFLLRQARGDRERVDEVTRRWLHAEGLSPVAASVAVSVRAFAASVFGLDEDPVTLAARGREITDATGSPSLRAGPRISGASSRCSWATTEVGWTTSDTRKH